MPETMKQILETPGLYEILCMKGGCFVTNSGKCFPKGVDSYLKTDPAGVFFLQQKHTGK